MYKRQVPNHAAIYCGDGELLHHIPEQLSTRERYTDKWQRRTHSLWPVSYTHLDVYKRQEVFLPAQVPDSELDQWMESRIYPAMTAIPALAGLITTMVTPVSYTHLDVYKRQGDNTT